MNFRLGGKAERDGDEDALLQRNSFEATRRGLAGKAKEAVERFEQVALDGDAWEQYCRQTFEALLAAAPARMDGGTKLGWMLYPRKFESIPYWLGQQNNGALLLGAIVSPYRTSPFILREADIATATLVRCVIAHSQPEVNHLWKKLPKKVRESLPALASMEEGAKGLTRALLKGMNGVIRRPLKMPEEKQRSIFDAEAFANVNLSGITADLLEREENPPAWELARLNRSLLEEIFPNSLNRLKGGEVPLGE